MSAQRWYAVEYHTAGAGRWKRHPHLHDSRMLAGAWAAETFRGPKVAFRIVEVEPEGAIA